MEIPVIAMVLRSGWVARIILLILGLLSVLTWAIIFSRWWYLSKMSRQNKALSDRFNAMKAIGEMEKMDAGLAQCPMAVLAKTMLSEYQRILADIRLDTGAKTSSFYLQNQFEMATDRIFSSCTALGARLRQGLILLAIASSAAPFLGLLGTVWGIMNSFYQIGNQGSASLPVVAPGIAEALITTIVGLAVAIPALFFYNVFAHQATRMEDEIESFGDSLVLRLKREIFALFFRKKPEPQTQQSREPNQ
jgi:biopolymer transport protein TolQ